MNKIPFFQQKTGNSCGLAVLRMIFGFYGLDLGEKDITKQIQLHSFGTFLTDLGIIALNRGFKATIYTFHLPLLSSTKIPFGTKITNQILSKIKPSPTDKMTFTSWQNYLKKRGRINLGLSKTGNFRKVCEKYYSGNN